MTVMKVCKTCQVSKPVTEFTSHNCTRDKLRPSCKACCKTYHDARYSTVPVRARILANSARHNAKRLGKEFEIDAAWVEERLTKGVCEVSGLPLVLDIRNGERSPWAPSLDRQDASLGYTKDNVKVVCLILNVARNNWGDEPLRTLVATLASKF